MLALTVVATLAVTAPVAAHGSASRLLDLHAHEVARAGSLAA